MKNLCFLILLVTAIHSTHAQTISQFRGPERTGIYPDVNLLKSWSETGPELLWKTEGVGNGFSSPVISEDKIFLTGEIDSTGYLFSFDKQGKLLWKVPTGKEWTINFPGPRSSPTVVGDHIYYCSSMGQLLCFNKKDGTLLWKTDMVNAFHGINIRFGYTESILVDKELIFCSPGGTDTNVVALNRFDGKLIWKSRAMGDSAAYVSPTMISLPGVQILTTLTIHHLIGIDATTGELLWSQKIDRAGDIHCNAPLFDGGSIYVNDRGGNGVVKYELGSDGKSIREIWRNFKAGNVQSGFIKSGDFLYGSRYRPARFESLDAATGQVVDSLKFSVGSTIFADSLLYCYGEDGTMGLIRPDHGKISLISSFKITGGTNEHFAHPAIDDGILYIRHGNVLFAYNIRERKQ